MWRGECCEYLRLLWVKFAELELLLGGRRRSRGGQVPQERGRRAWRCSELISYFGLSASLMDFYPFGLSLISRERRDACFCIFIIMPVLSALSSLSSLSALPFSRTPSSCLFALLCCICIYFFVFLCVFLLWQQTHAVYLLCLYFLMTILSSLSQPLSLSLSLSPPLSLAASVCSLVSFSSVWHLFIFVSCVFAAALSAHL